MSYKTSSNRTGKRPSREVANIQAAANENEKDYYAILGITSVAGQEEIKKAYRALAKRYHPDVNKEPAAHERFVEIGEAYEVLSRQETRSAYDRLRRSSSSGDAYKEDFARTQAQARSQAEKHAAMSLDELLEGLLVLAKEATKVALTGEKDLRLTPGDYLLLGLKGFGLLVCAGISFSGIGAVPGILVAYLLISSLIKDNKIVGIGPLLASTACVSVAIGFSLIVFLSNR